MSPASPLPPLRKPWRPSLATIVALGTGVFYGVSARLVFGFPRDIQNVAYIVMSVSFLFGVPLGIGAVYVFALPRYVPVTWPRAIFGAIATSLLTIVVAVAFVIEGSICAVMAAPMFAMFAGIGGAIGKLVRARAEARDIAQPPLLCAAALFPFVLAPCEQLLSPPTETRTVANDIRVNATPEAVWREIRSVPRIDPGELPATLSHVIGFPRPLEATLDRDGVGAVRIATFERGLSFREEVTVWEPGKRLAFAIHTKDVPKGALDEHVGVGGRYFDVLDGVYDLEPVASGGVMLHLASRQRLSMRFNNYAALWTDFVMHELQQAILQVVAHRAERRM